MIPLGRPQRECAQCRAKHLSISRASSLRASCSRRSLHRLAHNRRPRQAPTTGGSASHCRMVTTLTPCIAGLPLRRPRLCLARRNTAFFARYRRTQSEGRVIRLCPASAFSASRADLPTPAPTSIATFSDGHASLSNGVSQKGSAPAEPFGLQASVTSVSSGVDEPAFNARPAGHRLETGRTPPGRRALEQNTDERRNTMRWMASVNDLARR